MDTATAAKRLDLTEDGVRYLCRNEKVDATRIHGRWWVSTDSLETYNSQRSAR